MPIAGRGAHVRTIALGALMALATFLPAQTLDAPVAAGVSQRDACSSWTSSTTPPRYIRVLRVRLGRVERVPLRQYVVTVMAVEWPGYLPQALVEAGAVAVRQYAWYHAMHPRITRHGRCYDVKDSTDDQLYKPRRASVTADHYQAADATSGVRLVKDGQLLMTAYRTGVKVACGHDRTGWKLFARSAIRCARNGYSWRRILSLYYGPNLQVVSAATDGQSSTAPTGTSQSSSGARLVDDRSRSIVWRGSWRRIRRASAIDDSLTFTGRPGSSATFQFSGRSLDIIGPTGPHSGAIAVYVDGRQRAYIDLAAPSWQPRQTLLSLDWSTSRMRTVSIVVRAAGNRTRAGIDGLRVG